MTVSAKKLIEVALPLEAINKASAREKSIRHGHPAMLHLWWARRPLAAARAVIFAQMVDDPSARPDLFPTEKAQEKERQRLFKIIEDLVQWENTNNEKVLQRARDEIWESWRRVCADNADHPRAEELFDRDKLPAFHDPFAGGGALPLEAQRLGLEAYASDLNPVAVLICKAMIEIPPKFAGRPPVNPDWQSKSDTEQALTTWKGAQGLAEDVRHYGKWMREEAAKRIGHLYPKVEVTAEMAKERPDLKPYVGKKLTVIAWLWARTVKSPNPAFSEVEVPLATTFMLSTKAGKEAYVEPVIEDGGYRFTVKAGKPADSTVTKRGTKSGGSGTDFLCLISGAPMPFVYLRDEAKAGRMGARLMAVVAQIERGRVYLTPTGEMEAIANNANPQRVPETDLPEKALGFRVQEYGMTRWSDLFTSRQLVALTTFSDLVQETGERVKRDGHAAGLPDDGITLAVGGANASAYADAVATYLALLVDQQSNQSSTICGWNNINQQMIVTFSRQAIPMVWDFAECNVFSTSTGSLWNLLDRQVKGIASLSLEGARGSAFQSDATGQQESSGRLVATDPPYYDNIGYADLSDFFYVWLRRSIMHVFPDLFATLTVPKTEELVATPHRHGSKKKAEAFFLEGMTQAMTRLAEQAQPSFPVTVFYAFKQSESGGAEGTASTGWETFLDAVIRAGFAITGTWPVKTESANKLKASTNALASSVVLVCRPGAVDAPTATRRQFVTALKTELPGALAHLQRSNIAPVDLAQAAIGPGMAVYTRYARVMDAEGKQLPVRVALELINDTVDEVLARQEGGFDADTRWAVAWFEHSSFAQGEFGVAETLSKAKNTSIAGMVEAGIIESGRGKVRLLRPIELPENWDPAGDRRLTAWEMVHQLVGLLESEGESSAARLAAKLGSSNAEVARGLAYRLYNLCDRKKWAEEALSYNALVQAWPEIMRLAASGGAGSGEQSGLGV